MIEKLTEYLKRDSAGRKLKKLSEKIGVDISILSRIINGKSVGHMHTWRKIAAYYGRKL
jgi:hypothetical protein